MRRGWYGLGLATVLLAMVIGTACGAEESSGNGPATTGSERAPTSATTRSTTTTSTTSTTTAPPTTAPPTTAPPTTAPVCSPERISGDLPEETGGKATLIGACVDGWAEITRDGICPPDDPCADNEALVHFDGGRWVYLTGFPSVLCLDKAVEAGVPAALLGNNHFQPCPPPEPAVCPRSPSGANGPVKVVVASGTISCDDASAVIDKYLNDPSIVLEGSSAFGSFDGWECYVDNIPNENGAFGSCGRDDIVIEMR